MVMRVFPFVGTACPRRPLEKSYSAFIIVPLLVIARRTEISRSPSSRSVQTTTKISPLAFSPIVIHRNSPAEDHPPLSNLADRSTCGSPSFREPVAFCDQFRTTVEGD